MKALVLILCLVLTVGCEESGTTGLTSEQQAQNFIPDDPAQLGDLARHILDTYPLVKEHYYSTPEMPRYDKDVVSLLKSLVQSYVQAKKANATYDMTGKNALTIFKELTDVGAGKPGVDHYGLAIVLADVLESFRIKTRLVKISGDHMANLGSAHTVVEMHLYGHWVALDPTLNLMWASDPLPGQSALPYNSASTEIAYQAYKNNVYVGFTAQGFYNHQWPGSTDFSNRNHPLTFEFYKKAQYSEFFDKVYKNVEYVNYADIN